MIDIHSHILPEMDDGSSNSNESLQMLRESWQQGIQTIVATPHFYARQEQPEQFLQRRTESFRKMKTDGEDVPQVILGAEVAFFSGMTGCDALRQMCIGDSGLLLVEMPFADWTNRMVDVVCSLPVRLGVTPVLAHVERYFGKNQFPAFRDVLEDAGAYFQCNAEFFLNPFSGAKAMRMLGSGQIHFLGSDCHNMDKRPQKLGDVAKKIQKKLGLQALRALDDFGAERLCPDSEWE